MCMACHLQSSCSVRFDLDFDLPYQILVHHTAGLLLRVGGLGARRDLVTAADNATR